MPTFMSSFPTGTTVGYAGGTTTYRTRSVGGPFSTGVIFERDYDLSPPLEEEIIIAPVKVRSAFRRLSIEEGANLPAR